MKLASVKNGRDGKLVVVSRDLKRQADVSHIAPTLQHAMDNWNDVCEALNDVCLALESNTVAHQSVSFAQLAAPLPRAYQWLDASAFTSHGDLMIQAFKLTSNPQKPGIPLIYQGGSDDFYGPCDDMAFPDESLGIDFEGEFAVIVDDVPMGVSAAEAEKHIKLIMLANDWSLRGLAPEEMKTGFGWLQSKPSTSFSPVAITPDELGDYWQNGRVNLPLQVSWNGKQFGHPHGSAMTFSFGEIIAFAARTRKLKAGTVLGSGTVSEGAPERVGSACIAEQRGFEMFTQGKSVTPFMSFGDTAGIECTDKDGHSFFGRLEQRVVRAQ